MKKTHIFVVINLISQLINKLFRQIGLPFILFLAVSLSSCSSKYSYETVPNDPLKARIYTLDNGLKVYMTVNKETPRIQTYIAVRVGGKNDPAETTGLAHYFEHLMFKGTNNFGTQNYEVEKPLLDKIEQQFEIYRKTTDSLERKAIYARIDSLSYEASKYAIPNEYVKLMAAIGANGTNAYTSFDVTCYTEDIPGNQVDNWAKIQAERFKNCVIRGFHTELETVYEEKNMAICLSGDFDPDQMIATIDKYFGGFEPNPNLPKLDLPKETPITAPIVREVLGPDAESVALAWRFPGAASKDVETLQVVSKILYNGQAGLFDLNLTQQQKTLSSYCYSTTMSDYSALMMQGRPKQGQSLDEVKGLMLGELKKLRDGDFDDKMLEANMTKDILKSRKDAKLNQMQNFSRLLSYATYGPSSQEDLLAIINKEHQTPDALKAIPAGDDFQPLLTPETKIFIAPYDAKQIYMSQISNKGEKFDPATEPARQLYNEYFGGGMNSIVFQEMRESRGLAYSAWAGMSKPTYLTDPYTLRTQIATQNDKMVDAINTFNDIINNMPESEAAFKLAKESIIARLRTDRTIKMDVIWDYISAQYLGQNVDSRIKLYNDVQNMTLKDVVDFQKKWIKGRTYTYCILGDKKELDMAALKKVGPVIELKQEDIFGY